MLDQSIYDRVQSDCELWGIEDEVHETAKKFVKEIEGNASFEGKPLEVISAGCIFAASRQCGVPRTFREISEASGVEKKDIGKMFKLLQRSLPLVQTSEVQEEGEEELELGYSYTAELGSLFRDTAPITLSFAFQNIVEAFSIMICARLGTFELSVASYGYMFFNATGIMVAIGGSTAIDTLCSQAFTSSHIADRKDYLGIILQRGLIFLTIFFVVVFVPVWWHSASLFRFLGQEAEFAAATEVFLKYALPAGVIQIWSECLKKFLQVQNHSTAVGWCIGISAIIGAAANVFLVLNTPLGVYGSPLALALYHTSILVSMVIFIASNRTAQAYWGGFSMQAFQDLGSFIFLAMTGILTVATEFWCFESIALMAATLDPASVGAQGIILTSDQIFATVPVALSVASSHRIGKALGAGNGPLARFQSRIPYLLALIAGTVEGIFLFSIRNIFGYAFSSDNAVVEMTAKVLPLMAVFQCLDISNGGAAGVLRGAAKTHLAGVSNLLGYYGVGLPLAWFYCFRLDLGLFGLWFGLITGSGALVLLQSAWVFTINWDREAEAVVADTAARAERMPLLDGDQE